ncbi:MAG: double zinc ribbon domain-containing protein [Gemmatimonadales bacterium]
MTAVPPTTAPHCAACGAPVTGRFCSRCGAAVEAPACASCGTPLSPGARFCHRCGAPARPAAGASAGSRERVAWIVAAAAVLLAVAAIAFRVGNTRPATPVMANAGNAGSAPPLPTRGPDISQMSPRERFDRLYDRIMRAAEAGDSVTVAQFAPMALGAYDLLDRFDADARYHASLIHLTIGQLDAARALADTIETEAPGHLFAELIRGEVAERTNDADGLTRSYRAFLARYDAELRTGRTEYQEHRTLLEDFRTRARATLGTN